MVFEHDRARLPDLLEIGFAGLVDDLILIEELGQSFEDGIIDR